MSWETNIESSLEKCGVNIRLSNDCKYLCLLNLLTRWCPGRRTSSRLWRSVESIYACLMTVSISMCLLYYVLSQVLWNYSPDFTETLQEHCFYLKYGLLQNFESQLSATEEYKKYSGLTMSVCLSINLCQIYFHNLVYLSLEQKKHHT